MNTSKLKKMTISLAEFNQDLTPKDKIQIDHEVKYYHLSQSLKQARAQRNLTQEKLSQLSKIPRTTIAKIESGSRNTTIETLMTLATSMNKKLTISLT